MHYNGPVYFSDSTLNYMYPYILSNNVSTEYTFIVNPTIEDINDFNDTYAWCDADSLSDNYKDYVFDLSDCDGQWFVYDSNEIKSERSLRVQLDCDPTPYPSQAPTVSPIVNLMRLYIYYSSGTDLKNYNQTKFAEWIKDATLTAFNTGFSSDFNGYIDDFDVCDVNVGFDFDQPPDYAVDPTFGNENCPFVLGVDVSDNPPDGPYYAAFNFKIYAAPDDIINFGDEIITFFEESDTQTIINDVMFDYCDPCNAVINKNEGIYTFNRNDTTTTSSPITTTSTPSISTTETASTGDLIFKCNYDLTDYTQWQSDNNKNELFADYLQNATLSVFYDLYDTYDELRLSNFEICAVFDSELVNGATTDSCPTDDDEYVNIHFSHFLFENHIDFQILSLHKKEFIKISPFVCCIQIIFIFVFVI